MKVLRLIPVLDFGGVESRFVLQASEWNASGIEVEYCSFWKLGAAAEKLRSMGVVVHVLNEDPSVRNWRATVALLKLVRRLRPDIIHSSIGEANFHNMLISKLGPWKCIIEEAGIPNRRLRNRLIHAALYRATDHVIAVSQASADYLLHQEWAPKTRVEVIPNAILSEFFSNKAKPVQLGQPVLFRAVGRLTSVKNYPMLVRAFVRAYAINPNIRLEIVGEGEDRARLETEICTLGAEGYISLRGFVSNIAQLHNNTDFFLMPSLSEGFGLAAAEPMALGVPGIGSKVGGLYTVFGPLADKWLLPPEDEVAWSTRIIQLSHMSEDAYHSASRDFAARAETFSPRRYVKRLETLYRR